MTPPDPRLCTCSPVTTISKLKEERAACPYHRDVDELTRAIIQKHRPLLDRMKREGD